MPRIGPYELHTIETGRFGLDGGAMFGIVPRPLWERYVEPDDRNRIPLNMRCLLLEGQDKLVLIDNGMGEKYDQKFADLYAVDRDYGTLEQSLSRAGFKAEEVTDVILTHLHFDHCGGSTRRRGDRLEPTFRNARYHVQRAHFEWASDPNERERASFLPDNIQPLVDADQLALIDGEEEILPGIEAIVVDGHTEAQQLLKISDDRRTLVYVADLLPTAAHLRSVWIMAYDIRPLVTLEEKNRFLDRAVEGEWDFFFEHDPATVIATPYRSERGIGVREARPLEAL